MRGWRGMQETEGILLLLTAQWGRDGTRTRQFYHTHGYTQLLYMCLIPGLFGLAETPNGFSLLFQ